MPLCNRGLAPLIMLLAGTVILGPKIMNVVATITITPPPSPSPPATVHSSAMSTPIITTWSYTVPESSPNHAAMWTADDWLVTDPATGKERPWQNRVLACGDPRVYANLTGAVLARTGVLLPVWWAWSGWIDTAGNTTALNASWQNFQDQYAALRAVHKHLPAVPDGIFLGDEPGLLDKPQRQQWLAAGLELVKSTWPTTITYLNMLYRSLACDSSYDNATYHYCCCNGVDGAEALAMALGRMSLDLLSTDEYYDVALDTYERLYRDKLYPHLREDQKVLLVPFAAYCEIGCAANASLVPMAEARCLGVAKAYTAWYSRDSRVTGLVIYRLKNIWRDPSGGADVCLNEPNKNGLGLVDRCGSGGSAGYATLETLRFYQNLTASLE